MVVGSVLSFLPVPRQSESSATVTIGLLADRLVSINVVKISETVSVKYRSAMKPMEYGCTMENDLHVYEA